MEIARAVRRGSRPGSKAVSILPPGRSKRPRRPTYMNAEHERHSHPGHRQDRLSARRPLARASRSIEEAIGAAWEAEKTFQRSIERRREQGAPEFVFYDGPPFANGLPHYGHIVTGFVKDMVPRYQTMRGKTVERRFGWDCHGLPAELHSEKELKLSGRRDILKYGMARFNEHCRTSVMQFRSDWEYYVNRSARWVDFDNDYRTMDLSYMESAMWAFKQLWDKGLVYEGYPRRALFLGGADAAVAIRDAARQFLSRPPGPGADHRLPARPGDDEAIARSCSPGRRRRGRCPRTSGLAVAPDADYAVMEKDGARGDPRRKPRASTTRRSWRAIAKVGSIKGAELIGRTYEPLFPFFADEKANGAFRVIGGEFIEMGEGTGVVHIAPAFGEDDLNVGQADGLPVVDPVDLRGQLHRRGAALCRARTSSRPTRTIIRDLKARGRGRPPRDLRPQLSALLAHRPAADLQGDALLVRRGDRVPRPHGGAQQGHHLGARAMSATASSATGWPMRATGTSAATASGARRSRCGNRTIRTIRASTSTARSTSWSAISACGRRTCTGPTSTS